MPDAPIVTVSAPSGDARHVAESLRRRARALAAPARAIGGEERGRMLVFRRGAERFGVALERVAATFVAAAVTPLPGADAPVRGVAAWRSRPIAVYDLAAAGGPLPRPAPLVVVGDWAHAVALVADELEDVIAHDAAADAASFASRGAGEGAARLVRALAADATAVVDVDAVLSLFADTR